jgi:sugar lactone lactonase YvrE
MEDRAKDFTMTSELIFDAKAKLGEGPTWDAASQTLYWIDILGKRLYAGSQLLAELDAYPGCAAPMRNGHLIVGTRFDILDFDPKTKRSTVLSTLSGEPECNRVNDGKCDPAGRFLLGTMDMVNERDPIGTLYSFDGTLRPLVGGLTISNGIAWSPDLKTVYHIDTPTRLVKAYDYDVEKGTMTRPRVLIEVPAELGWPDGMTSDREGNLWIAMWGGAKVTRWNPQGKLIGQVAVPGLNTSSCVFGGKNLNELYVTTARKGMTEAELAKYPLTGGLFRIATDTTGMDTYVFG